MVVTAREKELIDRQGYAPTGGIPHTIYYTPDGRKFNKVPSTVVYNLKDDEGNVTGSGTRDANLDPLPKGKGWLLQPPANPVPYCEGCDNWHDTEELVAECIKAKKASAAKWDEWARKEQEGAALAQGKEIAEMKVDMLEMKSMMGEILKKLGA